MHGTIPTEDLRLLKASQVSKPTKTAKRTSTGALQSDQHRRDKNDQRAAEMSAARDKLVMRFLPFIWMEDESKEPVTLMETVAERLWVAAQKERQRRKRIHSEMYAE